MATAFFSFTVYFVAISQTIRKLETCGINFIEYELKSMKRYNTRQRIE